MFPKSTPLLLLALFLLSMLAPPASTGEAISPPDKTDLLECMEGIKANLKQTAMALGREDHKTALVHVAELQRFVLLAKLLEPANLKQLPSAERKAHQKQFRLDLVRLLEELAGMELDLLEGRGEAAFARVRGPLFQMREQAHGKYKRAE